MEKTEILKYFFQAYFHQDWAYDYPTPMDAVRAFIERENDELQKLLKAAIIKEIEEKNIGDDFIYLNGGYYSPKYDGIEMEDWLHQIADML